jgi:hypothetical protein
MRDGLALRRRTGLLAVAVALVALAIEPTTAAAAPAGAVSVEGAHLTRDGAPWMPRGVQIVGLVAPDGALSGKYTDANAHFGAPELQAARAAHADTIRFQVSQFGLDPLDPLYSRAYLHEVQSGIELARSLGLSAIVSLQAQPPAGRSGGCPLPDLGAERVWNELAPMFASDPGVMFELYNEPSLSPTAANWQMWTSGGLVTQSNGLLCQEVGMQTLIDDIRRDGAGNVIIVPGLGGESTLAGMPALGDPSNASSPQLAYGIHYPSLTGGSEAWDRKFGNFSTTAPVIVSEWYASSIHTCTPDEPARATWLLDYLASKQIGVVGYAFDVPTTIVADWSYAPTTFSAFACGVPGDGPGQALFGEFAGLAQADGPSPMQPRAWVVSYAALRRLETLAPSLVRHFFNTPRAFIVGAAAWQLRRLGTPAAIPTAAFSSEAALARAITAHVLSPSIRAVLYNDAYQQQTPRAEQLRPAVYYHRAARQAHAHGLLFVAAPDPELVLARAPKTSSKRLYGRFVSLRIAAAAARYADVYSVQAQSLQGRPSTYRWFVGAVAAQAAAAHPDVELMAELSTDPPARHTQTQTSRMLVGTAGALGPMLAGYLLDDPPSGPPCAFCVGTGDSVAIAFLRALRAAGF